MLVRITGRVIRTDSRSGEKVLPGGELKPWSFDTIRVLVAEQDIVELTRFTDSKTPLPVAGEDVDYAVNVNLRTQGDFGARVNLALDKPWSELVPVALPKRAHAA